MNTAEKKPMVALTFDDGPNRSTSLEVLDILEKYGVTASFFLIGDLINEETAETVKRAVDMGCEINNHTRTHPDMTKLSADEIRAEVRYVQDKIREIVGKEAKFFRPPFICVNQTMYDCIDMPFICGVGCEDWVPDTTAEFRIEKMLEAADDGVIYLLHDMAGNKNTVKAIDAVIPKLLEQGYIFVTLTELFEAKGADMVHNNGMVHSVVK